MVKYARAVNGEWNDLHEVPSEFFKDIADLERKTGVKGFVAVDDAVKSGDFVEGDSGFKPRQIPEAPIAPPPQSNLERILERLDLLDSKVDALTAATTPSLPE